MFHMTVVLLLAHLSDCVCLNSEGKRFVLAFPPHATNDIILTFIGTPDTAVNITFRNDVTHHVIESDGNLDLQLNSSVRCEGTTEVQNNGLEVEAVSAILLHVFSGGMSTSGYMALPVDKLSSSYFLPSVDITRDGDTNRWTVVALENNTDVTVHLRGTCSDTLTFNLNKYDVIGGGCEHDFTGSDVMSNKPIAVFYSTDCTDSSYHIEEMLLPVVHYGKHYVLSNAIYGSDTSYKIIVAEPSTILSYSYGVNTSTTEAGDAVVFTASVIGQTCLLANKPVLVVSVNHDGTSLSVIQPVERFLNKYYFKMTENVISGHSDLKVTLTFHETYLEQLPVEYQERTSTIGCCRYVTATTSFVDVFNLHLEFPFGAHLHRADTSYNTATLIDIQFGSTTCPSHATYSTESNLCLHNYVEEGGLSWTGSRDFCGERGQHLLQLDTQAKNEFVIALLAGVFNSVYIGANDMDGDGVLTWENGDSVSYTNWADNSTVFQGKCVVLKRGENHKWGVQSCGTDRRRLCQEDMVHRVDSRDLFYCQDIETSSATLQSSSIWFEETTSHTLLGTSESVPHCSSSSCTSSYRVTMTTHQDTGAGFSSLPLSLTDVSGTSTLTDAILETSSVELSSKQGGMTEDTSQALFTSDISLAHSSSPASEYLIEASLTSIGSTETLEQTPTIDTSALTGSTFVLSTFSSIYLHTSGYVTEVRVTPTSSCEYQTLYSAILTSKCECQCKSEQKYSDSNQLALRVSEIKALLTIEKNSLTKQRGRFISRGDARPSAVRIGYSGVLCLVGVACFVVLPDVFSLVKRSFARNRKPITRMKHI